jgi:hypothetical protein
MYRDERGRRRSQRLGHTRLDPVVELFRHRGLGNCFNVLQDGIGITGWQNRDKLCSLRRTVSKRGGRNGYFVCRCGSGFAVPFFEAGDIPLDC